MYPQRICQNNQQLSPLSNSLNPPMHQAQSRTRSHKLNRNQHISPRAFLPELLHPRRLDACHFLKEEAA
jgi:hypothetical protein